MTKEEWGQAREGAIVQGVFSGEGYFVAADLGDRKIVIRVLEMSNPDEWNPIRPSLLK